MECTRVSRPWYRPLTSQLGDRMEGVARPRPGMSDKPSENFTQLQVFIFKRVKKKIFYTNSNTSVAHIQQIHAQTGYF